MGAEERAALKSLSKVEGRPINQLLNEAIKNYLRRQGRKERSLDADLARLRAYRTQDPEFKKAIAALVEAEMSAEDPVEGKVVQDQPAENTLKSAGTAQSKIREVLGA